MHSIFQFGHLHIPVFGAVVSLGVMAAMALTQWSAPRTRIAADTAWNAGFTAIVTVLVVSRVLLVAFNFRSFVQYPLLLLALPSLTSTGVLLSAIFIYGYVRWRSVPLLPLLDCYAPSAALLWLAVSAGYLLDGTRDGMPVAISSRTGVAASVAAQPVEVYTLVAALVILLSLLLSLRSGYRTGEATGLGLAAAGLAIFFIDFYRLPSDLLPSLWVDPAQIIAVGMILAGAVLLYRVAADCAATSREEDSNAI